MLTAEAVKAEASRLGFHRVGIASVTPAPNSHLSEWLAAGYQGDMAWLSDERRHDLERVLPGVRSVIAVALNYYWPGAQPAVGKIARYAWGRDYHRVVGRRLKAFAHWLQQSAPDTQTRAYVDTGPVAEKLWAEWAGLGWVGKHSNLITRQYGSWVVLGEVLTTLELTPDAPHREHCGTCTRCLEACPTQAIVRPFVVDSRRCIAYHTIENRQAELPPAIAANLQGWLAGCDICQEVCPWNQRFAQPTDIQEFAPRLPPWSLRVWAALDVETWDQSLRGSALRRIKPAMWRRNAQALLANTPPEPASRSIPFGGQSSEETPSPSCAPGVAPCLE
ncbi:putative iron-sulfur cluster binding protein [Gloeomargarita lithophora Alchichica-D10]|uniref:Epoxyqueuosine reductase n=1 Tax=Gloeomargarita lithophora Alchichica-D10 TaxID=1188229 RepID=A0A1J0AA94_9CYAN|nr:tRNA epoxyqueuosine(34) reductase QueG [Gloeomargarita lithophora]APB32847.1 putative iron-sulfur cluster binding protein [Gloeomargarita lithophora Alchichica-D10]